jgi:metal-dependent amidase/aminoacylase/carboxypeptidase family protein
MYQAPGRARPVMVHAALDTLPIEELSGAPYRSRRGKAHLFGHGGYVTILAAHATMASRPPASRAAERRSDSRAMHLPVELTPTRM